ncbi:MAG: tRNA uridine-5-carboxymethylaminomethyl(34) synthesis GTPase MnmE [Xanthomonadales bacterium]|nr:tRNA uridine-5-carboxymethylaminomethyl(34) synthesis GTPase MnmE [Xanthomonadales bacterium]
MRRDTIAAIATPPGAGGIGVLRISGPGVPDWLTPLTGRTLKPRRAELVGFLDDNGQVIDRGIALYFPEPGSFTGEAVLELQGHGGPVVMGMLLERVLSLGARLARPGEFSERAFLNDKLDLAQAEAIADLIGSATRSAARAAVQSMEGALSRQVATLQQELVSIRVFVESAIDFPTDEIDFLGESETADQVRSVIGTVADLRARARQGRLLRDGLTLALAGRPNAGKSSLLNALSGRDSAIVTDIPGTTRDLLRERVELDGIPLHLVDTAGLRQSDDRVEQEGVRRARRAVETADHTLLMVDDSAPAGEPLDLPPGIPVTEVHNKIDLSGSPPAIEQAGEVTRVYCSVKTGAGMDLLSSHLKQVAGLQPAGEGQFIARARHLDALARVQHHLEQGLEQLEQFQAGELLAEELRLAQQQLSEITGEYSTEDLLGAIFSSFCIGK